MKKVLILQGLPASGKSSFAKELLLKEPGKWVRTNKDLLREMCHASYWTKSNEKFILQIRDAIILEALEAGKHVIIDDTNFGKNIDRIKELVKGKARVEINRTFLQVPVEECIKRDLERPRSVGKDTILQMYKQYLETLNDKVEYNPELPDAIIVDMDGTLAILCDRSPYDVTRCHLDLANKPVLETVLKWQTSAIILVVSGRTDDGRDKTEWWLEKHGVKYQHLYMRKTGDLRKDSLIKQEIYEQFIRDRYNISFILDDRQQVVDMWRSLGLTVFQVAEGNF
jgi:predicted kinase